MPLSFVANSDCPKCEKLIRLAVIDTHPTRADMALRSLHCAECGHVQTTLLSIGRRTPTENNWPKRAKRLHSSPAPA
jgi:Zn ribbon nucleic-acid-binding protein